MPFLPPVLPSHPRRAEAVPDQWLVLSGGQKRDARVHLAPAELALPSLELAMVWGQDARGAPAEGWWVRPFPRARLVGSE